MVNHNITEEELEKKFNSLPEEIQDIIYSPTTTKLVQEIGEKYELHIDKINNLMLAVEDTMTGDVRADEFISHITKELQITDEVAQKIGQEIDQQVFEGVRDAIKSIPKKKTVSISQEKSKPTIAEEVERPQEVKAEPVINEIKNLGDSLDTDTELSSTQVPISTDGAKKVATETKPTIADIKTKTATSSPTTTSNYDIDPYREPIE